MSGVHATHRLSRHWSFSTIAAKVVGNISVNLMFVILINGENVARPWSKAT